MRLTNWKRFGGQVGLISRSTVSANRWMPHSVVDPVDPLPCLGLSGFSTGWLQYIVIQFADPVANRLWTPCGVGV